ncbi:hypothetical protein DM01DRAFT_1410382 [Hesseltinella vesiculosa]|uniref:S-adenosyl-L-methionine-dependent methyltransferase n=1 Tax=Hesseltinella vesiculosa TaxID=101127 RepID=A0A1X2G7C7_9FUNG|nr:hypothetical protein DM01DRAFT_1410382 [Hesseltinella vesiculosa]
MVKEDTMTIPCHESLIQGPIVQSLTKLLDAKFFSSSSTAPSVVRFLDIGCGPGECCRMLKSYYGERIAIVGIDPSDSLDTVLAQQPTDIQFFKETIDTYSEKTPAESFDVVFFSKSLHHCDELQNSIDKARKLFHPSGLFIFEELWFPAYDNDIVSLGWLYDRLDLLACAGAFDLKTAKEAILPAVLDKSIRVQDRFEVVIKDCHQHSSEDCRKAIFKNFGQNNIRIIENVPLGRYWLRDLGLKNELGNLMTEFIEQERRAIDKGIIKGLVQKQYLCNDVLVCYPGSVFEGTVMLTLSEPLHVSRLKVVFKGAERVNAAAMGWEKTSNDGRLFAVRTTLLGSRASEQNNSHEKIPAGVHMYNFAVEMPLVNYPPSLDEYLVGCTFSLFACLDLDARHTFKTDTIPVSFRPTLCVAKPSVMSWTTYDAPLHATALLQIGLPCLDFNLFDTQKIPFLFKIVHDSDSVSPFNLSTLYVRISLKRTLTIYYNTYRRSETIEICHMEHLLADLDDTSECAAELSLKKAQLLPTVDYSTQFHVNYSLSCSLRTRHGLWNLTTKKKIFELPIEFGTLSPGTLAIDGLHVYTDVQDPTDMQFKPRFLQASQNTMEYLPAYEELTRPPSYCQLPSPPSSFV